MRLSGPNRYATSAVVAQSWPAGTPTVFVANGQTFPDALTAASRAGVQGAPLLLTRDTRLPDETTAALRRLRPLRIVVVGGAAEVSASVVDGLKQYASSGQVVRVGGDTAYATSLAVSRLYPAKVTTAYLASGEAYPDALAGAALAGHQGAPLVLTRPSGLDAATRAELGRLDPQQIVILGGPATISDAVLRSARSYSRTTVRRIAGSDRYRTAAAVAAEIPSPSTPSTVTTYVASGQNFPDALVGAAAAARDGSPVLLTPRDEVHPVTARSLSQRPPHALYGLGGEEVIYSSTMTSLGEYVSASEGVESFTPLRDDLGFTWSGQRWSAKEAVSQGPGPNRWHRSGVELGDRGSMKLKVQKNAADQWQSAEVVRDSPAGYGTFSFTTTSSVLPPNERSVLGLFTYQHNSPAEGHEEIDIEYAEWGKPGIGPGSITLHKPDPPWIREFSLDYTGPITHSFLWAPGYVRWRIVRDDTGVLLHERELWGDEVPTYSDARMRMNLWLMDGVAADRQEPFEVTFSSARWTPLPAGFTTPPASSGVLATADLVDAFDTGLQTSRWPGIHQYGTPSIQQGRLDLPLGPGYHGLQSDKEYRLADAVIAVEQVRPRGVHPYSESEVTFARDARNSVSLISVGEDVGRARIRTGGVDRSVDFVYDRIEHRWLRIRASGSWLYFEASPDGRSWSAVTPRRKSPRWVRSAVGHVKLGGGNGALDDPAGSVQFDNLNRRG
ncbi:MAG: cell wall-binding repeat-containing protein [Ornithinimicrobium sp.]